MTSRPNPPNGLRHLALVAKNLEECVAFYTDILGMRLLHKAHDDLIYLTLGNDNLSLGRARADVTPEGSTMDHFGFIVDSIEELEQWFVYLQTQDVELLDKPHNHGDGARSFHLKDPAGNVVQPIYHPALSGQTFHGP